MWGKVLETSIRACDEEEEENKKTFHHYFFFPAFHRRLYTWNASLSLRALSDSHASQSLPNRRVETAPGKEPAQNRPGSGLSQGQIPGAEPSEARDSEVNGEKDQKERERDGGRERERSCA